MDLLRPIDIYCERTAVGLLAEPFNLISNLAFIVAGMLILRNKRQAKHSGDVWVYGLLCVTVGIGSGLFHSIANAWSQMADIIPIGVLVLFFIYSFSQKVLGLSKIGMLCLYLLLIGSSYLAMDLIPKGAINGSESYLGVLFCMLVLAKLDNAMNGGVKLLVASGVFALSLTFRSIDMHLCRDLALGTHFLWHTLNGVMLYILGSRYWAK
jgi:hypothetical protein